MSVDQYRPDDLAAFKRRIERIEKLLADQQRRAPLRSSSISDDDGNIIVRFNADGLQFLNPLTGDQVAEFAGENLTFRDDAGNPLAQLDDDGIHVLDAAGNEITTIDDLGLTVSNAAGVAQLKAGNLNGAGDYGVEIGGGRARAQDAQVDFDFVVDASLTTTAAPKVTVTITPPSWATESHVFATMQFQMRNSTAGLQAQWFRTDIDGVLGSGLWTNDVPAGEIENVSDTFVHTVAGNSPFDVDAVCAVNAGTNSDNVIRLYTMSIFLR